MGGLAPARSFEPARSAAISLLLAALLVAATLVAPPQAEAAGVTGVRVESASSTGFVVRVSSLGSGWTYRLYASTAKPDVYYDALARAPHRSSSTSTRISLGGLRYTTKPVWYRVQAAKGSSRRTSEIFSVGLRPSTPTGLTVTRVRGALTLRWGGGAAGGAQIQQATNAGFTAGVRTHTVTGTGRQLTPVRLTAGTRYWFRVRSRNLTTASRYTAAVSAVPSGRRQDVRVMTYNILTLDSDGKRAPGGRISPWSQRRTAVARSIKQGNPDLIGLQEGAAWTGAVRGPRQVDDVVKLLGGTYGLARTETPPSERGYFRTGRYILYRKSAYAPVGRGGHWDIGSKPVGQSRYAAYQVLRHRGSGASVLFVSVHLSPTGGRTGDRLRQQETSTLLTRARSVAGQHGNVPIVYAGDVNSHVGHALDGPALAMAKAGVADGYEVSRTFTQRSYNSANQYLRRPPATRHSVDHVYASPGVSVRTWGQVLQLSDGRFAGVIPSDHNPVVAGLTVPY